jgi:hypothetical protein
LIIGHESIVIQFLNKGVYMKQQCQCSVCNAAISSKELNENDLHIFVGKNSENFNSDRENFECDLNFESVIYWDVGMSNFDRYYIYLSEHGECIAWYDNINNCGFKSISIEEAYA